MNAAPLTALYAATIALVFVLLSVRTLTLRRRLGVAIGDGDKARLARAVRAHGNCAEYVPIALILMYFLELVIGSVAWIHTLGGLLIVGRIAHAYGVSQIDEDYRFRVFGMALTFTVIISAALRLILAFLLQSGIL